MIKGTGIDIVQVSRVAELHERYGERFTGRILAPGEIGRIPPAGWEQYMAGRFAAKEALVKASGVRGLRFSAVEVRNDRSGWPSFVRDPYLDTELGLEGCEIHLSISHERDYAVAMVIIEGL